MTRPRGFTIVELLVVVVLGTLLLAGALQVLTTNRRVFTVQNSKVTAQQSTRAAMDVLFSELREVSSAGGDVLDFDSDTLAVRAMRRIGVVCDALPATHGSTPQLLVRRVVEFFELGDSLFAFADNDEFLTSDDTWVQAMVTAIDTTAVCPDGAAAQLMTFNGQSGPFKADSVQVGAPVRSFEHVSYGLGTYAGQTYLGRSVAGGDWAPLVGPLVGTVGRPALEMSFLDGDGNVVTAPADVRQMSVMLRSWGKARDASGALVVDSLSSRIFLRN